MEKVSKEDIIVKNLIGMKCPMWTVCHVVHYKPEWVMEAKLMDDFCHHGGVRKSVLAARER